MFKKDSDPFEFLFKAMAGESTEKMITGQEKQDQKEFVSSEYLPKKIIGGTRQQFEQMGIVFGKDVDDLFVSVTLPKGWKKVPFEHDMWSYLADDKGRERASIFFKATFYDRNAHMFISQRYSYRVVPVKGYDDPDYKDETAPRCGIVTDCGKEIWRTISLDPKESNIEWFRLDVALSPLCEEWLADKYPDWKNPLAYWD